ncbi:Adaptor protein complex sigma subunit [Conidiobolus coronatus NRRL 28638]|uniref:AP complex subunit sigma n=1 Tax=Conidiobolus coronatus (strain ATCC 28846 / CBS 209.66 / NRRL 28638) TaxID=796925 RepID=A0A137P5D0_CONC2|nr:Adaptor protein complex sigma subunit [Conidiobolus coronatus NRRL 28638]|eukprot:KXN70218.1 Adaptor protein complex sigma subunit [Conidiobolus coronatus NRRL 28638]
MGINYLLLINREGKVRLNKFYKTLELRKKNKILKDVSQLVLGRKKDMCNFVDYEDTKIVYRKYASLYFVVSVNHDDNELITLEIIHRYVEILDRYFGNVCELDIIFNFEKAYNILDELIVSGELLESNKAIVLNVIKQHEIIDDTEKMEHLIPEIKYILGEE